MSGKYEVLALKYAETVRPSRDFYISQDPHDGPLPISYFLWLVRNEDRTIVVDIGFEEAAATARGRNLIRHPVAALKAVGRKVPHSCRSDGQAAARRGRTGKAARPSACPPDADVEGPWASSEPAPTADVLTTGLEAC
jgi:hypothetical protein